MKKIGALLLTFLLLSSAVAVAAEDSSQQNLNLEQIEAKNKALEAQIAQLKAQLDQLQASQQAVKKQVQANRNQIQWSRKAIKQLDVSKAAAPSVAEAQPNTSHIPDSFSPNANGEPQFMNALRDSVSVITSPYLGLRSSYDASDLIVNLPSMNEDLVLLQQRQDMQTRARKESLPYGDKPLIMISGDLLPQMVLGESYQNAPVSQVTLSGAELDIQAISGTWAAGFLAFNFDNSTYPNATGQNVSPVSDSRVYISRGFVTIGNLNRSPIYLTAGQMYAPFGSYSNSLVTTPLTQSIGRVLMRAATLGYSQYGVYSEIYTFNGSTNPGGGNNNVLDEGGVNIGYKNNFANGQYDIGMGYITDMADSQGAQSTGNTTSGQFQGFGQNSASENIQHRVPGGNIHLSLKYNSWFLRAEFINALKSYSTLDMTYNGGGAKPSAAHFEADYNRQLFNRPWTFVLAYDHAWQALAYNLPEQSYFAVVNVSIWKDTIESIEFRHDVNYSSNSTAIGSVANSSTPITPLGPSRNTVTVQFGLYF